MCETLKVEAAFSAYNQSRKQIYQLSRLYTGYIYSYSEHLHEHPFVF